MKAPPPPIRGTRHIKRDRRGRLIRYMIYGGQIKAAGRGIADTAKAR